MFENKPVSITETESAATGDKVSATIAIGDALIRTRSSNFVNCNDRTRATSALAFEECPSR